MNDQIELLSATECSTIAEALYELVQKYPRQAGKPKAEFDALGAKTSLAVFVVGGRYKQRYISGGFTAEVNFSIAYKSSVTSSDQRIDRQEFVGEIVKWLENEKDLPRLTDNRIITSIAAVGVPYKSDADDRNNETYAQDAVMEYRKKGMQK